MSGSASLFFKPNQCLRGNKQIHFAQAQESAIKDVERAFGVLQARFAIVCGPARFWKLEVLKNIMKACIILHNMIVENERTIMKWTLVMMHQMEFLLLH